MVLCYLHHSGFLLYDDQVALLFDYDQSHGKAKETAPLVEEQLRSGKPFYIFASHNHGDHFDPVVLTYAKANPQVTLVLSKDIAPMVPETLGQVQYVEPGQQVTLGIITLRTYGSTDQGVSFYVEAGGKTIFHAGDLNNWHWNEECPAEEAAGYEAAFLKELALVAREVSAVDVAMFPLDPRLGADYMRGATQFLDAVKTGLFAPMHFWGKFSKLDAFQDVAQAKGARYVRWQTAGEQTEI